MTAWAGLGHAQVGSGGVVGTTAGTLSDNDFFIGVQKVEGVNLSDVDKARFLNHASCQCKRDVWIKAILASAASAATAQRIAATDVVSMVVGFACDNLLYRNACLTLDQTSLSQFRLSGMTVHTTVDALAKSYGGTSTVITTVGTGGDSGSGGTTGTGGSTGTEPTTATDPCAVGDAFMQTVYILVESSPGVYDGNGKQSIVIDGTPPPAVSSVSIGWANEALTVSWTPLDSVSVPDLQGYQVFCTRADQYQVFKDGTFSTSVDSCPLTDGILPADAGATTDAGSPTPPIFPTDMDPMALSNANTHYICSDFLSTSTSSHRVQILQNDISYGIAVAAVDSHGNASLAFPTPLYTSPMPTIDFYQHYRSGNRPAGQATGGCSVVGDASAALGASALAAIGVVIALSRKPRRGRRA